MGLLSGETCREIIATVYLIREAGSILLASVRVVIARSAVLPDMLI